MKDKMQELEHLLSESLLENKKLKEELEGMKANRDNWREEFYKQSSIWGKWCEEEMGKIKGLFGIEGKNLQEVLSIIYDKVKQNS